MVICTYTMLVYKKKLLLKILNLNLNLRVKRTLCSCINYYQVIEKQIKSKEKISSKFQYLIDEV